MTAADYGRNSTAAPLRVYVAGLEHETNSFSPLPTNLRNFEEGICYRPGDAAGRAKALAFPGYGNAVAIARERGDTVVEGPFFSTEPSGLVVAACYERLRDEVLDGLARGPFDLVVFVLHGAMAAHGTNDCEGDLLARAREMVGPDVPIGAIMDLHGNVSRRMVDSGAILVGVKEYPHTDYPARTAELYAILADMVRGGARPTTTVRTIPLLGLLGTTEEPMRGIVRALKAAEQRDGIRSITLMHGFPWADWEEAGASVVVVSEGAATNAVEDLANEIAERFEAALIAAPPRRVSVEAAVRDAAGVGGGSGPVVIADSSDNAGGGAGSDSTYLLRELIDRDVHDAAFGLLWDPQAARIAADAGTGSRIALRIGGKVGPLSGDPLDVEAEVLCVRSDARQRNLNDEAVDGLGLAVAIRVGGIEVVLNSIRQQVYSTDCFTELGIDVAAKAIVVVKSSQHFRASFDTIARKTIYCDAPGSLNMNLATMPYRHLRIKSAGGAFAVDRSTAWFRAYNASSCQDRVP